MKVKRAELKRIRCFYILKELWLLLRRLLPAVLYRLRTLHHLRGLVSDMPSVRTQSRYTLPFLGLFDLVRPARRPSRRLLKPLHFWLQLLILRLLHPVSCFLVHIPGSKIPLLYLDIHLIDRENMIHAGIQEIPVMRHQDESLLPVQISRDLPPSFHVQMIRRLVDQEKTFLSQE